jgi:hypothetical protein
MLLSTPVEAVRHVDAEAHVEGGVGVQQQQRHTTDLGDPYPGRERLATGQADGDVRNRAVVLS